MRRRQTLLEVAQPRLPCIKLGLRMGDLSRKAISSYLISLYCSAAILADDAVAVLEGVEINKYHECDHAYQK